MPTKRTSQHHKRILNHSARQANGVRASVTGGAQFLRAGLAFLASLMVVGIFVLFNASGYAQRQGSMNVNAGRRATEKPTGVVKGRVVYEDTGRPVRRAKVHLLSTSTGISESLGGVTDFNGSFRVEGVSYGTYLVAVDSPGVLSPLSRLDTSKVHRQENPNVAALAGQDDLVTVAGPNDVEVVVRARRGGSISGTIKYSDGDPATNVLVGASRKSDSGYSRIVTRLSPPNDLGVLTDDRGVYRLVNLPEGDYIINATEENFRAENRGYYTDGQFATLSTALNFTYYPSESSSKTATKVHVGPGQEVNNIDLSLVDPGAHLISGTVISAVSKKPVPGATISLKSVDTAANFLENRGTHEITVDDGTWGLTNIPDGEYTISVSAPPVETPRRIEGSDADPNDSQAAHERPEALISKKVNVTILGEDRTGIQIQLGQAATISGTITMPASSSSGKSPYAVASPIEQFDADGERRPVAIGRLNKDGRFLIEGVEPGIVYLAIQFGNANEYSVKSATYEGKNILESGLEVHAGEAISGVRIEVVENTANGNVTIIDSKDNKPAAFVTACLFPADSTGQLYSRGYLCGTSDYKGVFSIRGAPGDYVPLFLDSGNSARSVSADYIKSHLKHEQVVSLKAGDNNEVRIFVQH